MSPTVEVGTDFLRLGDQVQVFGVVCDSCRHKMLVEWCHDPRHPTFDSWVSTIPKEPPAPKTKTKPKLKPKPDLDQLQICPSCERFMQYSICPECGVVTLTTEERLLRKAERNKGRK